MKFLEALYGSQYSELEKRRSDPQKGRFNGNLFLSAFVLIFLFIILLALARFSENFNDSMSKGFKQIFGRSSGKTIGRLIAIPVLAIIYMIIHFVVDTKENYNKYVQQFLQYPDEIRQKANRKILMPFLSCWLFCFCCP